MKENPMGTTTPAPTGSYGHWFGFFEVAVFGGRAWNVSCSGCGFIWHRITTSEAEDIARYGYAAVGDHEPGCHVPPEGVAP